MLLAQAAQLTGRETEFAEALARAHHGLVDREQHQFTGRCAFWLGFSAMTNGEAAKCGGWLARAGRSKRSRIGRRRDTWR